MSIVTLKDPLNHTLHLDLEMRFQNKLEIERKVA